MAAFHPQLHNTEAFYVNRESPSKRFDTPRLSHDAESIFSITEQRSKEPSHLEPNRPTLSDCGSVGQQRTHSVCLEKAKDKTSLRLYLGVARSTAKQQPLARWCCLLRVVHRSYLVIGRLFLFHAALCSAHFTELNPPTSRLNSRPTFSASYNKQPSLPRCPTGWRATLTIQNVPRRRAGQASECFWV